MVPVESLSESEFKLFEKMYIFFNNDMDLRDYGHPISPRQRQGIREWLSQQRRIAGRGKWKLLAARVGGELAGYTSINLVPQDKSVRQYEFFVWPKFRGPELRIGDRFLLEGLKLGRELGYKRYWIGNISTIPSNPGLRKLIERTIGQTMGRWPEDYPRSLGRKNPYSRIYYTKEGAMGLAGNPNWARPRAIRYKDTFKGYSKFPSFTMPINEATVLAAEQRLAMAGIRSRNRQKARARKPRQLRLRAQRTRMV